MSSKLYTPRRLPLLTLLSLALLPLAAAGRTGAEPPGRLPDLLLQELQRSARITGMSAAIVRDGTLVWHGQSGLADIERQLPVKADTVFRLGSVSKFITVAMLAEMVGRKQIDLAQPVQTYLPDFPVKSHPITLAQLATHTSGVPHYQFLDLTLDSRATAYTSAAQGLDVFKDRALLHPPGSKYLYSTFGFNLLSAAMESAAGQSFPLMVRAYAQRASAPSLQLEVPGTPGPHWSRLYRPGGTELERGNVSHKWAGGGMLSSAGDLARAGLRVLDAAAVPPSTLAQFSSVAQAGGAPIRTDRFELGMGWRMSRDQAGRPYLHHSGTIDGGRAHLSVYPGERIGVALLANTNAITAMDLSAEALLEAAQAGAAGGPCHAGEHVYSGSIGGEPIAGQALFATESGYCKVTLSMTNVLGTVVGVSTLQQTTLVALVAPRLPVLPAERAAPGEGRAYLVTPAGIFRGQASAGAMHVEVMGKALALRFD